MQVSTIPQELWVKVIPQYIREKVMLSVQLEDRWLVEGLPSQEDSMLKLTTKVAMPIGHSFWVGGIMRKTDQASEVCLPFISRLPVFLENIL